MVQARSGLVPVPQELLTIEGMAEHLTQMASTTTLHSKAAAWFGQLTRHIQLALVRSVRTKPEDMRKLLGLVPDSTELLSLLELPLVRRLCDGSAGFLSAVEPERALEIVRETASFTAKREWLGLIAEAYESDQKKFEAFLAGTNAQELASVLADRFKYDDIELLDDARLDPAPIDSILDRAFPFVSELHVLDEALYEDTIEAIQTLVFVRFEERRRSRTLDELQQRWPGFMRDVKGDEAATAGEPADDGSGEEVDDEPEAD